MGRFDSRVGICYTKGEIGRLVREDNRELALTKTFEYDCGGNLLRQNEYPYSLADADALTGGVEVSYTYGDGENPDLLTAFDGQTIVYNAGGCPTSYLGHSCTYTQGTLLASYDGHTFSYDADGLRVQKDGISYFYTDGVLRSQTEGDQTMVFSYGTQGMTGFSYGDATYFYRRNLFGDVTHIYTTEGVLCAKYLYDAWGNHTVVDAAGVEILDSDHIGNVNPIRYRGYYYDTETRLYFLQARYYDPKTGRFLSQDHISYLDPEHLTGLNLFAYCNNNPVMYADPSGNSPKWWQWTLSGLATVGGIALCFVPGAQGLGVSLLVSGGSMLASNIMSAAGVDGKTASLILSGIDIVFGTLLCFTPFAGVGASMIGSGVGGIAGGYISEALGYSFEVGAMIGNIAGGFIGTKVFDGINTAKIAKNGTIVLGEGMKRVIRKADEIGAVRYNGMPGFKRLSKILPKAVMDQLGLAHNARWIRWVGKAGANIVDIGIAGTNSPNYLMEILYIGRWLL